MKISTKTRYALRLMLDLEQNQGDFSWVSLKDVAERQGVSKKYLEQIVAALHKYRLLLTSRGNRGGYRLARDPRENTLGQIMRATEATPTIIPCLDRPLMCPRSKECLTRNVWMGLKEVVEQYVDSITLAAIAENDFDSDTAGCMVSIREPLRLL